MHTHKYILMEGGGRDTQWNIFTVAIIEIEIRMTSKIERCSTFHLCLSFSFTVFISIHWELQVLLSLNILKEKPKKKITIITTTAPAQPYYSNLRVCAHNQTRINEITGVKLYAHMCPIHTYGVCVSVCAHVYMHIQCVLRFYDHCTRTLTHLIIRISFVSIRFASKLKIDQVKSLFDAVYFGLVCFVLFSCFFFVLSLFFLQQQNKKS